MTAVASIGLSFIFFNLMKIFYLSCKTSIKFRLLHVQYNVHQDNVLPMKVYENDPRKLCIIHVIVNKQSKLHTYIHGLLLLYTGFYLEIRSMIIYKFLKISHQNLDITQRTNSIETIILHLVLNV